jgi:hypothetical protein
MLLQHPGEAGGVLAALVHHAIEGLALLAHICGQMQRCSKAPMPATRALVIWFMRC